LCSGDIDLVMARGKVLISGAEYHDKKGDGRFLKRGDEWETGTRD